MPQSGHVVVSGSAEKDDPRYLFVFSLKNGKLNRKNISSSCDHKYAARLSSLIIDEREQLVVSCEECDDLKLLDLQMGEWSTAYTGCTPRALCSGGSGRIFVQSRRDQLILELDCTRPVFKGPIRTIHTNKWCMAMCYIPPPVDGLVLSDVHSSNMVMKSVERDEIIWKFQKQKEGTYFNPMNKEVYDRTGLLFHQEYNALFIADGYEKRVLIVDPGSGRLIQTIDLSQMHSIFTLCLYSDQLVMLNDDVIDRSKISYLKILK